MDVRPATVEEVPDLTMLGALMHYESPRYAAMDYDQAKVQGRFRHAIGEGGCFVAYEGDDLVGMAAAMTGEHFFSRTRFGADYIVYVLPEHRGGTAAVRLVRALERWAASKGATEMLLGVSVGSDDERTARLYERLGYRRSGISLVRDLKPPP
jgi:GNAT superfamily N-acetyltransferase